MFPLILELYFKTNDNENIVNNIFQSKIIYNTGFYFNLTSKE